MNDNISNLSGIASRIESLKEERFQVPRQMLDELKPKSTKYSDETFLSFR